MKKAKTKFQELHNIDNLYSAWNAIRENVNNYRSNVTRTEVEIYKIDLRKNLESLKRKIVRRTFKFAPSKGVEIAKKDSKGRKTGKYRPIVMPPIQNKIVQRALLNVLVSEPKMQKWFQNEFSFGGIRRLPTKSESHEEAYSRVAVPGAIEAILKAIARGAKYYYRGDIASFFTKISKASVLQIVSSEIEDIRFNEVLKDATKVELDNLEQLTKHGQSFPLEDLGVAQGSSLSPFYGNILLADFDRELNQGDCRCIRYIDDFIILAPTIRAANARWKKAKKLLQNLGMEISKEKSTSSANSISNGFEFLGVNCKEGLIRPTKDKQSDLISKIDSALTDSIRALDKLQSGENFSGDFSYIKTLRRVDGIINGWGKAYKFCNDNNCFANLDNRASSSIDNYNRKFKEILTKLPKSKRQKAIGVSSLSDMERNPLSFPKEKGT